MTQNKPPTEYDLLMEARSQVVTTAVSLLKSYAQLKAARPDGASAHRRSKPEPAERATDALYELMQLQFAYGNRLAQLQGEYGVIAMRALERWYSAASRDAAAEHSELEFTGTGPQTMQFTIENRLGPPQVEAEIEWTELRGARPAHIVEDAIDVTAPKLKSVAAGSHTRSYTVPAGTPGVIRVTVNLDKCRKRSAYTADLTVRMGGTTRTILIKIGART